jgi:hypothetical protein
MNRLDASSGKAVGTQPYSVKVTVLAAAAAQAAGREILRNPGKSLDIDSSPTILPARGGSIDRKA